LINLSLSLAIQFGRDIPLSLCKSVLSPDLKISIVFEIKKCIRKLNIGKNA
jgi:hypothetical protein